MTLRVLVTIASVEVDPQLRDALRRYLIDARVDELLEGELPEARLRLLVHSPSLRLPDLDPVGKQYVLTLEEPVSDPYLGPLEVAAAPGRGDYR